MPMILVILLSTGGDRMQNRFIMVTGSSFGVGKSTVSAALCQQLTDRKIRSRWLSEDELLEQEPFASFDHDIKAAYLLKGARGLFNEATAQADILIIDALLPGYFWLFGRYPPEYVEAYGADLGYLLQPLCPMIVYLQGDITVILERAVAQRGVAWASKIVDAVMGWSLSYYPDGPIQDRADLIKLLAWLDQQSLSLVKRWSGDVVILDVTATSSDDLTHTLLAQLKLPTTQPSRGIVPNSG